MASLSVRASELGGEPGCGGGEPGARAQLLLPSHGFGRGGPVGVDHSSWSAPVRRELLSCELLSCELLSRCELLSCKLLSRCELLSRCVRAAAELRAAELRTAELQTVDVVAVAAGPWHRPYVGPVGLCSRRERAWRRAQPGGCGGGEL